MDDEGVCVALDDPRGRRIGGLEVAGEREQLGARIGRRDNSSKIRQQRALTS